MCLNSSSMGGGDDLLVSHPPFSVEDTDTDAIECPLSGTATLPDGSTVYWAKDTTAETITLTVTDASGTITQLIVPVGDFKF